MDDEDASNKRNASSKSVTFALLGNLFLLIAKVFIAWLSGSTAIMAESLHSLADVANQLILALGIKRSKKKADKTHQFGYGKERYYWNHASAIFLLVGAQLIWIFLLTWPRPFEFSIWSIVVLGLSLLTEGVTFIYALRGVMQQKGTGGFLAHIRETTDTTGIAVVVEDGMAVLTTLVAFAGIIAAVYTGNDIWDKAASGTIAVLISIAAIFLVSFNGRLLLDRAHEDTQEDIERVFKTHPAIERYQVRTIILGHDRVLVTAQIELREEYVFNQLPRAQRVNSEVVERITTRISHVIDEIKAAIHKASPEARPSSIFLEVEQIRRFDEEDDNEED